MLEMKIRIEADNAVVAAIKDLTDVLNKLSLTADQECTLVLPINTKQTPKTEPETHAPSAVPIAPAVSATPAVPVTPPATQAPAAQPAPEAPAIPTAAPQYTLEMISAAGSALIDAGKMDRLLALLGKCGVDNLTALKPDQYGAMATDLRALGARI